MSGRDPDRGDGPGCFASPPCWMHELDAEALGFASEPDEQTRIDVTRWRNARREHLIADRRSVPEAARAAIAARIAAHLDGLLGVLSGRTIGVYWPIHAQPDLRGWMRQAHQRGALCALPVLVGPAAPLLFRPYSPGMALDAGAGNLSAPPEGASVVPDVLLIPLVGFDEAGHGLGYGGGHYDRTLAGMMPRPFAVGVAVARSALATVYPLPHDIPMDAIVTECGVLRRQRPREAESA